jgi:hypothetical protein
MIEQILNRAEMTAIYKTSIVRTISRAEHLATQTLNLINPRNPAQMPKITRLPIAQNLHRFAQRIERPKPQIPQILYDVPLPFRRH